ncbi:MAG: preprotein translocase subunit SecG [Candidatus Cloacimonetes bacterium]|nr:preprotein translocase subunit SecG [Candidatus Cloacimonadota bacterium]
MYTLLLVIHVIVSIALILVILAQSSKGGALDGLVGSTASSVLGGQGASKFLSNATRILALVFMLLCVLLVFQVDRRKTVSRTAVDKLREEAAQEQQQAPGESLPLIPQDE